MPEFTFTAKTPSGKTVQGTRFAESEVSRVSGLRKEELVVDGEFPESEAGKELFKEFVDYTAANGPGELMHAAVFRGNGNHDREKRAREYVDISE